MRKRWLSFLLVCLCFFGVLPVLSACHKTVKAHSRYEITAEYVPKSGMLTGTVKVRFENHTDNEISVLKFQLYANAYRETALYQPVPASCKSAAYYGGESYGETSISSVNGAKNWEVMGEDENILYAYLVESLFPGDEVVLDIAFTVKLAKVKHTVGVAPRSVNLGNFFPILCGIKNGGFYETVSCGIGEPYYTDCADITLHLKVPKDFVVCASGVESSVRTLESKKEHTMSLTNARDFAVTLSPSYRVEQDEADGIALSYYHFGDKNAAKVMSLMKEVFAYFQKKFGAYPYENFTLAQTGLACAAPAFSAFAMLGDDWTEEKQVREIVQTIAMQWWGVTVGSDKVENAWQAVGLSAYTALTFFENYEKYGVTREAEVATSLKEYRSYYDVYGSVLGRTDTRMTRRLKDFINEYEYQCLERDKAVVMFDTLRKSVGDREFFSGLKRYYADCRFDRVLPADLVGAFERSGLDVVGFFDSFLEGKAVL